MKFNPFSILVTVVVEGVLLGLILAIAIPVQSGVNIAVTKGWLNFKERSKKKKKVFKVKTKEL